MTCIYKRLTIKFTRSATVCAEPKIAVVVLRYTPDDVAGESMGRCVICKVLTIIFAYATTIGTKPKVSQFILVATINLVKAKSIVSSECLKKAYAFRLVNGYAMACVTFKEIFLRVFFAASFSPRPNMSLPDAYVS